MIREVLGRGRKPLSELAAQATNELGKHHARLELAYKKLDRRNRELFEACTTSLNKGLKAKATIYATEISEIRKILSTLENTQLAVEQAILRLETLKTVSPSFENLKGVFGDVKNALGLMSNVMPSLTPQINNLNSSINEIMESTHFNLEAPVPLVVKDESTEAILQEASSCLEEELQKKIPVPPLERRLPEPPSEPPIPEPQLSKPLIAVAADGSEYYIGENGSVIGKRDSSSLLDQPCSSLSDELIMDYIERNRGDLNVSKCAKELNVSSTKIMETVESLSRSGRIRIER